MSFTQSAALELAPHGIRVNAIAPDICMTEGLERMLGAAGTMKAVQTDTTTLNVAVEDLLLLQ